MTSPADLARIGRVSRPGRFGSRAMVVALGVALVAWLGPEALLPLGFVLGGVVMAWATFIGPLRSLTVAWRIGLAGLLGMSIVGLYPSIDLTLSLPRLLGIVLGVDTLAVLLGVLVSEGWLRVVAWSALLMSLVVIVAGVLLTDWPRGGGKGLAFASVYDHLPQLIVPFPYISNGTINPNKLAAPLAMLLPMVTAIAAFAERWPRRLFAVLVGLLVAVLLVLTQSRSAYLAATGGVLVVLTLRSRSFAALLVPYVAVFGWVSLYTLDAQRFIPDLPTPPMSNGIGAQFEDRRLVWAMAVGMIEDFPVTGIGLGTFPVVADQLYGQGLLINSQTDTPHAHNLALQVGVDLGLPGLGFFALLTACAVRAARRAMRATLPSDARGLGAGAACALLAYYIFGVTDVIGLGEKPGLLFWLLLGMLVACSRLAERGSAPGLLGVGNHSAAEPSYSGTLAAAHPLPQVGQVSAEAGV